MTQIRTNIDPPESGISRLIRRQLGILCTLLFAFGSAHGAKTDTLQTKPFNPAGLQTDLIALSRMEAQSHSDTRLQRARNRLSAKWLPILQAAEASNDPIATLILRDCDSAAALDRKSLASTCSSNQGERDKAQKILARLGPPWSSDTSHSNEIDHVSLEKRASEQCPDADLDSCKAKAAILILETRLKWVEDNARLDIITPWNSSLCPDLNNRPDLQALSVRCETLRHHLLAVKTLARRHFVPSLRSQTGDADETERVEAYPYARFEEVRLDTNGADSGPDFQNAFYTGVYRSLFLIENRVRSVLAKEPRVAVFLHTLPPGSERLRARRNLKSVFNKRLSAADERLRDARIMWGYTGTYLGGLISNGTNSVITKLYPADLGLLGNYMMITGYGIDATVQLGKLGPCIVPKNKELLCIWHDQAGIGSVSMLFNSRNTEFRGLWNSLNKTYSSFYRMERRYWNEMTLWNGTLQ